MQGEVSRITLLVTQTLERLGIRYAVGGSLASSLRRSIITTDPEQSIYVISPEDTVLAKLEWYRLGGAAPDCQWRDVLGVLRVCAGELDLDYLQKWANELNVSDLLERARHEAE